MKTAIAERSSTAPTTTKESNGIAEVKAGPNMNPWLVLFFNKYTGIWRPVRGVQFDSYSEAMLKKEAVQDSLREQGCHVDNTLVIQLNSYLAISAPKKKLIENELATLA